MLSVQTQSIKWWPSITASVLRVCVFFFFWKTLKACLLRQGAWSPRGEAVLKVLRLHWIASGHILCKAGLRNVNHVLQWTRNWSRALSLFPFKCSCLWVFCCFIIGPFPLSKEALQRRLVFFLLILASVSWWTYQNCDWDTCSVWGRGMDRVVNNITGGPYAD